MAQNPRSASFPTGLPPARSEAEVRAIRARRCRLEQDLRAEGASEGTIAALATDGLAEKMAAHEKRCLDVIAALFGAP